MSKVWLLVNEIHDGPGYMEPYTLWCRDIDFVHRPSVGERLYFLARDETSDNSASIEVRNLYWYVDGGMRIELRNIIYKPSQKMREELTSRIRSFFDTGSYLNQCPQPWYEEDGDLYDMLEAAGWTLCSTPSEEASK